MRWKNPDRKSLTVEQREANRLKSKEYYRVNRDRLRAQQVAYRQKNKAKIAAVGKAYRASAKARISARNRKNKYGLTEQQFNALVIAQDFCCGVCRQPLDLKGYRTIHVDHDHKSGRVRGILCSGCNLGIGHLREDPAVMLRAIEYLKPANSA